MFTEVGFDHRTDTFTFIQYATLLVGEKSERIVISERAGLDAEALKDIWEEKGMDLDELAYAMEDMETNGHNSADFGLLGGFITSEFKASTLSAINKNLH